MACFALLCQTLRSTFGLPHFVFPGLRLVCSLSSFRSCWLEFGSPTDSLALLVSGRVSFPHRVGGAGGRDKVGEKVETRSHPTLFLLLPSPARQKMLRDENLSARETVRRIPATSVTLFREASVEDACDMEASSEVSDRPHGPWQHCLQAPSTACPPMSWPLCKWDGQRGGGQETGRRWKHFLPSFSSSRVLLLLPPSSSRLLPYESRL